MRHVLDSQKMPEPGTPFLVENLRLNVSASGTFLPGARLIVLPALRTSGLLKELPDREAKTLLALLTFLSPNGRIEPGLWQMAEAFGVSNADAQARMRPLTAFSWRDAPLAMERVRETGLITYSLSPSLVTFAQDAPPEEKSPVRVAAPKEAVIAASRARYAKTRAEVEREIAIQMGQPPEEEADTPEGKARRKLLAFGVAQETAQRLVADFGAEEVLRQADWLAHRNAKNPGAFVVAAIEGRYTMPFALKLKEKEQAQEEGNAGVA